MMTTHKQRNRQIPAFKSREKEAKFWDTHDFTDYMKAFTPVKAKFAKHQSFGSIVAQTAGALKSNLPALIPQEEHEATERGIAEEAIMRVVSS
jgi:hypothetical protein